jgi:hypothetical protein
MDEFYTRVSRTIPESEVKNPIKMCTEVAPTVCDETFATPNQSPNATEEENESEDEKPPMVFSVTDTDDKTGEKEKSKEGDEEK